MPFGYRDGIVLHKRNLSWT